MSAPATTAGDVLVTFGITGDYATTPDIGVLARGIEHGIEELTHAVRHAGRATPVD